MSKPPMMRPDPHPVRDFFIDDMLLDYTPKDASEMMERPFCHLAKRKRIKPLKYESPDGKIWVRILAQPEYGMANIWDFDILIYLISRLTKQSEPGSNHVESDTIHCTPAEILRGTVRGTGGREYSNLMDALNRLKNTTVETNIRATNKTQIARFNWISNFTGTGVTADSLHSLSITLPAWLLDGIRAGNVLTLDREYFRLTGGVEKALYRVARKHAGSQPDGFTIRVAILAAKVGSDSTLAGFRHKLKSIAQADTLPRYTMTLTQTRNGEEAVHFVDRKYENAEKAALRRAKAVKKHRDYARTAWVDAGHDPGKFEDMYESWHESGHDPAAFAQAHPRARLL
jgi:plasmid replication initiation protein